MSNFQMSKVCDATTHDSDAPTKQNLLCDYKSAMDVIASSPSPLPPGSTFTPPQIEFVQEKTEPELIIIQDVGVSMSDVGQVINGTLGQVNIVFFLECTLIRITIQSKIILTFLP